MSEHGSEALGFVQNEAMLGVYLSLWPAMHDLYPIYHHERIFHILQPVHFCRAIVNPSRNRVNKRCLPFHILHRVSSVR